MIEAQTLKDWLSLDRKSDEMRDLFFNMSVTLKYIHSHGYYVKSFSLNDIILLDGSSKKIRFNTLLPMSVEDMETVIRRDIYNVCFMMIGIELNCLNMLRPETLKSNFDEFSKLLESWNVPYFRGIIMRNAIVYYCDYVSEMKKQELKKLGGEEVVMSQMKNNDSIVNEINYFNRNIYQGLDSLNSDAFSTFLVLPLLLVMFGAIIIFITLFY